MISRSRVKPPEVGRRYKVSIDVWHVDRIEDGIASGRIRHGCLGDIGEFSYPVALWPPNFYVGPLSRGASVAG